VLLMDDQSAVRMVATQMLEELGCTVMPARNGGEALALFHEARAAGSPFDLAVLDLTVRGGMGGAELIRRIREQDPKLFAVVASGYSADPVLAAPGEHGFDAALPKPFSLDGLEAVLARLQAAGRRP
jgi:CheY-like chemotaxis protein